MSKLPKNLKHHNKLEITCSHLLYTREYLSNICTIFAQYLHNICTIFALYLNNVRQYIYNNHNTICTIFSQYLHNICTVQSAQYLSNITQYSQNSCIILVHDLYNIATIFDPMEMRQSIKSLWKTISSKFAYLHNICTIHDKIYEMLTQF